MNFRQRFLQIVYPAYVRLSRVSPNKARVLLAKEATAPPVSFYSLSAELRDGSRLDFADFKNKNVLLVNTASGCGFTEQYDQMQRLFKAFKEDLVVLAFPTNDFGEEKSNDEEIAIFCRENFRVGFPIIKKGVVKKGKLQHAVFNWLTDPHKNGWNSQQPLWNFCKYLVNKEGLLIAYLGSAIEPTGDEIQELVTAH